MDLNIFTIYPPINPIIGGKTKFIIVKGVISGLNTKILGKIPIEKSKPS